MSYTNTRRHIIDTLVRNYEWFEHADFSSRQTMGEVHAITSDLLYDLRSTYVIYDYRVLVGFKDFMDESAGYEVEIEIFPDEDGPSDEFVLFVTPKAKDDDDPDAAYERAMKIL